MSPRINLVNPTFACEKTVWRTFRPIPIQSSRTPQLFRPRTDCGSRKFVTSRTRNPNPLRKDGRSAFHVSPSSNYPFPERQPLRRGHVRTNTTDASSRLQPAERGIVRLDNRRLISLTGPDAAKFLQGLITNNVNPTSSTPFYSALLDARGRMLWDVFVYPTIADNNAEWGCLIEVDAGESQTLMRTLKKYKVRSKIAIRLLEEDSADALTVWAAWGNAQGITEEPTQADANGFVAHIARDLRAGNMPGKDYFGERIIMRGNRPPQIEGFPLVHMDQYRVRRYTFGIAEGPAEIQRESALPMECNVDLAGGIDFRKGCYLGQELTIRTKHQGVVRKRILPIQLYTAAEGQPPPEQNGPRFDAFWNPGPAFQVTEHLDIKQLDEAGSIKKGRSAGKLLARIGNVGLALCRLEMMTPMRVSAEGGSYKPGIEFAVQTPPREEGGPSKEGNELPVRVKAFLPEWLLSKESSLWRAKKSESHRGIEEAEAE